MQNYWEKWALSKGIPCSPHPFSPLYTEYTESDRQTDPENLLAMLQTWQNGDVSNQTPYAGDLQKALASIRARTLVLPSQTDLYFTYIPPPPPSFAFMALKDLQLTMQARGLRV